MTYCNQCGTAYPEPLSYPRLCPNCKSQTWANPVPVIVALLPVWNGIKQGLLTIRRGEEPAKGRVALVGGFLEAHETWQAGLTREVQEETSLVIDPAAWRPFWYASSAPNPNRVLLFATGPALDGSILPPFVANPEVSERGIIFGPGNLEQIIAFPTHLQAAAQWFRNADMTGEHSYTKI